MSTILLEFFEIENLFLKFVNIDLNNNKLSYKKDNYLTIEDEIINQLLLFITNIIKNKEINFNDSKFNLGKQIITESLKLLKNLRKQ